jgi:hypothetical protein
LRRTIETLRAYKGHDLNFPFPEGWAPPPGIAPEDLSKIQHDFLEGWQRISIDAADGHLTPLKDRRFAAPAWESSQPHLLLAHLYLFQVYVHKKHHLVFRADAPALYRYILLLILLFLLRVLHLNRLMKFLRLSGNVLESPGH